MKENWHERPEMCFYKLQQLDLHNHIFMLLGHDKVDYDENTWRYDVDLIDDKNEPNIIGIYLKQDCRDP